MFAPFCLHSCLEFHREHPAHAKGGKIETNPERFMCMKVTYGRVKLCSADTSSTIELFIQAGKHFHRPLPLLPFQFG